MKSKMKYLTVAFLSCLAFSCQRNELNKNNDTVGKAETYHLVEKRQRVLRYDCKNNLTSDRIETIQAPTLPMSVKPKVRENLYSSSFRNLTLNKTAGSILNLTDFTIDLNPGFLNLEVQLGSNQIYYQFEYCDNLSPINEPKQCLAQPIIRESGSIFINVTYENIDLPGTSTIYPNPEPCVNSR